jgi:peptidoglycan/xylan/chitin deacetylase (PgdA/CDA1 family)
MGADWARAHRDDTRFDGTRLRGTAVAAALAGAGAGAWVVHAAPAVTTYGAARNRLLPGLAGRGRCDHVALTFDDGPDPTSTPAFLDLLGELDVRATFFVLGEMLARAPELGRTMVEAGHELAVHGWDHRPMILRGPASTHRHLRQTRDLIREVTGVVPRWARPPNGIASTGFMFAARRLHLRPVLWTGWGKDWTADATPRTVLDTLAPRLRPGATLLLHDSDHTSAPGAWRSALGALPEIYARCVDAGLKIGPLSEHGLL